MIGHLTCSVTSLVRSGAECASNLLTHKHTHSRSAAAAIDNPLPPFPRCRTSNINSARYLQPRAHRLITAGEMSVFPAVGGGRQWVKWRVWQVLRFEEQKKVRDKERKEPQTVVSPFWETAGLWKVPTGGDTCHRCLTAADVFIEKQIEVLQNGPSIQRKGSVIYGLRLLRLKMAP